MNFLKLFNKNGNEITPIRRNGVWYVDLMFKNVSVGLFETEQLYIFEEVFKQINLEDIDDTKYEKRSNEVPFLIQFLSRIKTLQQTNQKPTEEKIQSVFTVDRLEVNEVLDYAKKISNYVNINFDYEYFFTLTVAGYDYLKTYNNRLEEEDLYSKGFKIEYVKPRANYESSENEDVFLFFKWKDDAYDKNIFIYAIDYDLVSVSPNRNELKVNDTEKFPKILPFYNKNLDIDTSNDWKLLSSLYHFDEGIYDYNVTNQQNKRRVITKDYTLNKNPFQINLAINSENEGDFERTLEIYVVKRTKVANKFESVDDFVTENTKIIEINLKGTIIGEDERFKTMLENFGRSIDENDFFVVKEYDLDDDRLDYIKINEKRKELLIEGENLFSNLGSYKSVYNSIKWLGYQNLDFREYFYNIRLSKPEQRKIVYSSVDLKNNLTVDLKAEDSKDNQLILEKYSNLVLSSEWKKTTRFGLVYKYNQYSDKFDENDMPIIEDSSYLSPEEILIKLYGLKKFLYKYFLPHNARIINITSEGIYFVKVRLRNWNDILPILNLRKTPNIDFVALWREMEIENLEELIGDLCLEHDPLIKNSKTLSDIIDNYNSNFLNDYKNLPISKLINSQDSHVINGHNVINLLNQRFDSCLGFRQYIDDYLTFYDCDIYDNIPQSELKDYRGGLFIIDFLEKRITMDDLTIPFDMMDYVAFNCHVRDFDGKKTEDIQLDLALQELGLCGEDYPKIRFTFDNFLYDENTRIKWLVKHEDKNFCKLEEGFLKDLKRIYVIAPYLGKYDVSCQVYDDFNFPIVKTKNDYLEVYERNLDLVAFGSSIQKKNFSATDITLDNWHTTFNQTEYCPILSTLDECHIEFDMLNYCQYLEQDFHIDYLNFSKIVNIDPENKWVDIFDSLFVNTISSYYERWKNKKIYFYRDPINLNTIEDEKIISISKNRVVLTKNHTYVKEKEFVNFYKIFSTQKFSFIPERKDFISVKTDTPEIFKTGKYILLEQRKPGLDFKKKNFLIKDVSYDHINKKVLLELENDGSLIFDNLPEHDQTETDNYNYSFWNYLYYRYEDRLERVKSVLYDSDSDSTEIKIYGDYKNLSDYENHYLEYGNTSGLIEVPIILDDIEIIDEFHVRLKIPNNIICKLTYNFNLVWSQFDWVHSMKKSKLDRMNLEDLETPFDYLKTQSFNTLDFHSTNSTGFKISKITDIQEPINQDGELIYERIPKLIFDDYVYEIKIDFKDEFLNWFSKQDLIEWKFKEVLRVLNSFKEGPIINFYFVQNGFESIEAIKKPSGNNLLYTLRTEIIKINESNTIPKTNFLNNEIDYWKDDNKPLYNLPYRYHRENKNIEQNLKNNEIKDKFALELRGNFSFTDIFIKMKDFRCDLGTPIFFTITKNNVFDVRKYEFEWTLEEETKNVLLTKSKKNYVCWFFDEPGAYSITLKIISKKDKNELFIQKKSWVTVN